MRSVLVGTAGHVDHGKTALVRALTGIDCDRLAEEKRRGITLDLGFAHLAPADSSGSEESVELAFVDVPGHERFLHNALAGLGGVRVLLLVVAADEGSQAQTREHLAIADLLELPVLIVALNKIDAVDAETAELVGLEIEELLATTRFAGAPIFPLSSLTGEGVPAIGDALRRAAAQLPPSDRRSDPARLPIDRSFLVKGQGVVVTGTLLSGAVTAGDELELLPARLPVRARSVQVHGRPRKAAAGERAALQLAGADLPELARGMELAEPGAFRATRRLLVRWRMLADSPVALAGPLEPLAVRVHLYASEMVGTARALVETGISPGETGLVEIALAAPVVAVRGDRVLVRRLSPAATIGGGWVLDPWWRRKRRGDPSARIAALAGSDGDALLAWASEAAERGLTVAAAAARSGKSRSAVEALLAGLEAGGALVRLKPTTDESHDKSGTRVRYLRPETLDSVRRGARAALASYFAERPLEIGLAKAAAIRLLLPPAARSLADPWFLRLAAEGDIDLAAADVRFPGRALAPPDALSPLAQAIVERYGAAGLAPPSPGEVARALDAKPQIVEGLVQHLVKRKQLVRLPAGLIFASAALARLAEELRATGWKRFSIVEFKDRFALTRKWAIPLLEYLDSTGVTRRIGEERELLAPRSHPMP